MSHNLFKLFFYFIVILFITIFTKSIIEEEGEKHFSSTQLSINHVSVLLSWNSDGIILKAHGSDCFQWRTTNTKYLKLIPIEDDKNEKDYLEKISEKTNLNDFQNLNKNKNNNKLSQYNNICSKSVQVLPVGFSEYPQQGMIIGKSDYPNGEVECEVIIDSIKKLKLLSTMRKLVVGDLQTLEVQGFDKEGNVFSSLSGLNFKWSSKDGNGFKKNKNIKNSKKGSIQLLPLNDKSVKLSVSDKKITFKQWKINPFSAQSIIVKGIKVGEARISSKLEYIKKIDRKNDKTKISCSAVFFVLDNFFLLPSRYIKVVPGSIIQYSLQNKVFENKGKEQIKIVNIKMPNKQFLWSSSNLTVGSVNKKMGIYSFNKIGETEVKVEDISFRLNSISGQVQVVYPRYIRFRVKPLKTPIFFQKNFCKNERELNYNKNLVKKKKYKISIELLDGDYQKMYIAKNLKFDIKVKNFGSENENILKVISFSENKQSFIVEAQNLGKVIIYTKLLNNIRNLGYTLDNEEIFEVFNPVKIDFPEKTIYLPKLDETEQDFQPKAIGGSFQYNWFSKNIKILMVRNKSGKMFAKKNGKTHIVVVDDNNCHNADWKEVSISPPKSIQFLPGFRETTVGENLCLSLTLKDGFGNSFASFSRADLHHKVTNSDIFGYPKKISLNNNEKNKLGDDKMCKSGLFKQTFSLLGKSSGFSLIKIWYNDQFSDELRISAFPKFTIINPKNNFLLIALGSSVDVIIKGGPLNWNSTTKYVSIFEEKHNANSTSPIIKNSNINLLKGISNTFEGRKNNILRFFKITCSHLTLRKDNPMINFSVKHHLSMEGAIPKTVKIQIPYSCEIPDSISIHPEASNSLIKPLPFNERKVYNIRNRQDIDIKLNVFDSLGNNFVAFESLNIQKIIDAKRYLYEIQNPQNNKFLGRIENKLFSIIRFFKSEGLFILSVFIESYNKEILSQELNIGDESIPKFPKRLEDKIELRVSSDAFISPKRYLLFNSKETHVDLKAGGGSGKFKFNLNNSRIAKIKVDEKDSKKISVFGLNEGYLNISASDLQFSSSPVAFSIIKISDIYQIKIKGKHHVQVGDTIEISISIFDESKTSFNSKQFFAMKPSVHFLTLNKQNNIVSIEKSDKNDAVYKVSGISQGIVTIKFSAKKSNGQKIYSKSFSINVFSKLEIEPKKILLIPGSFIQIKVKGGPKKGIIEYFLSKSVIDKENSKNNIHGDYSDTSDKIMSEDSISNGNKIADVYNNGIISAKSYGHTKLICQKKMGFTLLSQVEADIFVVKLTSLISLNTINIYENVKVPIPIHCDSDKGIVDIISLQSKNFYVTFSSSNKNIADIEPLSKEKWNKGHSVLIHGKEIKMKNKKNLKQTTEVSINGYFKHPKFSPYKISTVVSVNTFKKLSFIKYPMMNNIILPVDSSITLKTSKNTDKFSIIKSEQFEDSIISLKKETQNTITIKSQNKEGVSILTAEDENIQNQPDLTPIGLFVSVQKPVFFKLLDSNNKPINFVYTLPLGSEMSFKIVAQNLKGEEFSSIKKMKLNFKVNYYDSISFSKNGKYLKVKTISEGNTTLQISSLESDDSHNIPKFNYLFIVVNSNSPINKDDSAEFNKNIEKTNSETEKERKDIKDKQNNENLKSNQSNWKYIPNISKRGIFLITFALIAFLIIIIVRYKKNIKRIFENLTKINIGLFNKKKKKRIKKKQPMSQYHQKLQRNTSAPINLFNGEEVDEFN